MSTMPATLPTEPGFDRTGLLIGVGVGMPASIGVGALLSVSRDVFDHTTVALVFMIVVVAVAAFGGRAAGVITSLGAAASFDFFHTVPYLSLKVDTREDVETTVLLLVAALIVGTLASSGRTARLTASEARSEIARIHRVAEEAVGSPDGTTVVEVARVELMELLSLREARFEVAPFSDDASRPRLGRNGRLELQPTMHYVRTRDRHGFELPAEGVDLPVLARGREVGRFVLVATIGEVTTIEQRIVAVAIADQVGAAWPSTS